MTDLTQGSIARHLASMAAFIAAGLIFQSAYFIIDLYFVSRLGKDAVAGVAAAGNFFYLAQLAALGERAEAYGARQPDGRLVGVAAWVRPGCYPLGGAAQLRQAGGALWALLPSPRGLRDGTRYLLAIDKVHPKEPAWYLNLLVADPSAQRAGVGAALQGGVLERADLEGMPAYLETQNPDNLPYYRRFGYEVVDELRPVPHGPPLWTMRRPAAG